MFHGCKVLRQLKNSIILR
ncbi:MAG: hypothetical protein ACOYK8_04900 [Alphaproteobacteria bacterium]